MKKKKAKPQKTAVIILRDQVAPESGMLDSATQKKALEIYCRNEGIKIEDCRHSDDRFVARADFRTLLDEILEGSYAPDFFLFTSWEIFAPLLDRYPKTLEILSRNAITPKSIKNKIIKDSLHKQ